jgi:orotate phosphoribosyltransferase
VIFNTGAQENRTGFLDDILTTLDAATILDRFRRVGALLEGHFRLTSGLHSPGYLQSALVLQHPREAEACGAALAERVRGLGAQVVLSPALGGIVIGQEVARALGIRAIFAERQDGRLTLRRGFTLERGEKVLVVEDVVTTGGSTRETIDVARAAGAVVVGAAAIIDRSGGQPVAGGLAPSREASASAPASADKSADQGQASGSRLDVPFHSLAQVSLPTYEPESCPLCMAGQPVTKPGSRT